MKINKKLLVITTIIILLPIIIGLLFWEQLPETIATHWGTDNEPNGFNSKAMTVFGIPGIMAALHIFCLVVTYADPKKRNIGAKAIGMNHVQTMMNVIIPQAFRNIIPQIGNNFIINIKDTSVLSVISFADLFFTHKSAVGALYLYFESATITMAIYLVMTVTASALLRLLEKKLDGDDNYDLATTDTLAYTSGLLSYHPKKKKLEDFK